MIKTQVLVMPGVLDTSLGITLDVMAAANRLQALRGGSAVFDATLVGPGGRRVPTGTGLEVGPVLPLPPASLAPGGLVIVPGVNHVTAPEVLAWVAQPATRRAVRWLAARADAGAQMAAGCVGTFLLGEAGLLQGRCATTTWWLAPCFRERFPGTDVDMDRMVVEDGPVTSAGAALGQADLMLALVARHGSAALARECARYLLLDRRLSQARYAISAHLAQQTPVMQRADRWIRQHLAGPITLDALAAALHMTPRTVSRHFAAAVGQSPIRYIQRLRVEQAVLLLETGAGPLDEIAARVGYADASMLRRLMLRERGVTPGLVRAGARG
ncbi:MAG: helix-turn-helix domain-containing protein [Ramlibacter sp.]|jgi:transcriptional regulator GlxA family with amidase domain|nr:helix-turn-helix domain-containing protein [Ramlibacter sp.]